MKFNELLSKARRGDSTTARVLCLDPGNTTGWSFFLKGELHRSGEVDTIVNDVLQWGPITSLIYDYQPDIIICEDYKIYAHKLQRHSFSSVFTLRLIGGIDLYAYQQNIPVFYQMAATVKGFVTDARLKEWGYWQSGARHARDSIRHGCYYLLFKDNTKIK